MRLAIRLRSETLSSSWLRSEPLWSRRSSSGVTSSSVALAGAVTGRSADQGFAAPLQQHREARGGRGVPGLGGPAPPRLRLADVTAPHHQHTKIDCGLGVAGFRCGAPHGLRIIERAELDKLNARLIRIGLVDRGGAKRRGWGYSLRLGLIDPLI
jgi:hypothetical protein